MGMRKDAYVPPTVSGTRFLRLLADETRLRILALLGKTPDLCVCELVAILRLPQYQISRHLGRLRRSGLLASRREGPFVFYSIAGEARGHSVYRVILRAIPQLAIVVERSVMRPIEHADWLTLFTATLRVFYILRGVAG